MQDEAATSAEGTSLEAWIAARAPMSSDDVLAIALPLAAAVSATHVEGACDGALTLERVSVIAGGPGGNPPRVRIAARAPDAPTDELTAFASPEQVRGAAADEQCDQYAVAAIVWACLTGRAPFEERDDEDLAERIVAGIEPVSSVRPDVAPALARVVDRAASLDPMRRYTSVRALGDALTELAPPELRARWQPSFDRPSLEPRSVKERRDASGPVERPREIAAPPLVRGTSVLGGLALVVVIAVAIVLWAALAGRG